MRTVSYIVLLLLASGCDIFHSTDFTPMCEGGGCGGDAAAVSPFTTDSAKALEYAKQTCAWLAACEGPLGGNETGKCLVNAILAFDQTANPNRQPRGAAKTYWQCLYSASASRSCAAVTACNPVAIAMCPANPFVGCNGASRFDCRQAGAFPPRENCVAYGQGCTVQGNSSTCTGAQGQSCVTSGCSGANARVCSDAGVDFGSDCAVVGAGACADVFDAGVCKPDSVSTCTPSLAIKCMGGVAQGCQAGIPETVDCNKISNGCAEGNYGPSQPPSSACVNLTPSCSDDQCVGGAVNACVRGRQVPVDCAALGLGACTTIPTTPDGPRPACGAPKK